LVKPDLAAHLKVLSSSVEKQNGSLCVRMLGLQVLQFLILWAFEYMWPSYLCNKFKVIQVPLMYLQLVKNKHAFVLKLKF